MSGRDIYKLVCELYDIPRSITGDGVRSTLSIIKEKYLPELKIYEVATGEEICDWTVPEEWNIKNAYIANSEGVRIIDFKKNNLHVVGYSEAVDRSVSRQELSDYIYTLPDMPDAIPYVTSYYRRTWGFCMTENQRKQLSEKNYKVVIDSEFKEGSLTYADLVLKGNEVSEVFISTYICHPSMANNELSGPCLSVYLARWLSERKNRYTYRFAYTPETIGSIAYLSKNINHLKDNTIASFNLTCVGDDKNTSFLPSRNGDTFTDKVARHVLKYSNLIYKEYDFLKDRGSDERQYCSPGIDLPMVSIMSSKYGEYPEYHTSLDNLDFVSEEGFNKSFYLHRDCILIIESNYFYESILIGEPFLSKRGKGFMIVGGVENNDSQASQKLLDVLMCCDGQNDIVDIANKLDIYVMELMDIFSYLVDEGLVVKNIEKRMN